MCRNIKTLANFEPPATEDEVRASALQFVRKLSGAARPSRANVQPRSGRRHRGSSAVDRLDRDDGGATESRRGNAQGQGALGAAFLVA